MRHAILAAVLAWLVAPQALAQQPVHLELRSGRWTVVCARGKGAGPCSRDAAPGLFELHAWQAHGSAAGLHVALDGDSVVRVGTRSQARARDLGLGVLVGGLGVGAAMTIAGATLPTYCTPTGGFCNHGDTRWIALGITVGLAALVLGPPLMTMSDQPVLDVVSDTGHRRIAPDVPEVRAFTLATMETTLVLGTVALAVASPEDVRTILPVGLALNLALTPALVTLSGAIGGAHGDFGWAALGALIGAATTLPILFVSLLSSSDPGDVPSIALGFSIATALVGGVLGYEISNGDARRALESGETRHGGPTVLPTFGVVPGGAEVGVVGTL